METFLSTIEKCPIRVYKKGEIILLRGEIPKGVYLIEEGLVRVYIITDDGAERQIAFSVKGDEIPAGFSAGLVSKSEYFYEAYSDSKIRSIPKSLFMRALRADSIALYQQVIHLTTALMVSQSVMSALERPRTTDKIVYILHVLSRQMGTRLRPYRTHLQIKITQQDLANLLGTTRETVNHGIKKLESSKIVSHSRKKYIIDTEVVDQYIDKN